MDRPNAGAGQHRGARLWDHRQIQTDTVPLTNAQGFECIGQSANFAVQLTIRNGACLIGLITFPQNGRLLAAFC